MRYEKIYVGVNAKFLREGGMRPLEIVWTDGTRYFIDKVKFIERATAKAGGLLAKRYTVVIGGFEKYLYFEQQTERWFVEKKIE